MIVDIYCRSATAPPDGCNREEQEQICREYCEKQGLIVGMIHRDIGSGLEYRNRPGLTQLRTRNRQGEINGVVFTHTDRLSRSHVHVAILIEEMEEHDVAVHIVDYAGYDTTEGRFINAILAFVRDMEAEKRKDDLF